MYNNLYPFTHKYWLPHVQHRGHPGHCYFFIREVPKQAKINKISSRVVLGNTKKKGDEFGVERTPIGLYGLNKTVHTF